MKVIFMGTPDFAVPTLEAVIAAGHDVAAVYTQPARAAGRGQDMRPSPVQVCADSHHLPVRTPVSLKSDQDQAEFEQLAADVAVIVAYGLILPRAILDAPEQGCFNLHASLLPRWRGAAPIQRAIMAGDTETGVCVMRMEEGLDTGPVCHCERVPIPPGMTAGELHDQLATKGAPLITEALTKLAAGQLVCRPQPDDSITYASKIDKTEARIDFGKPAAQVLNHIHGLSPFPGAWFETSDKDSTLRIKLLKAELDDTSNGPPGQVLDDELTIACGSGAIRPLILQRAGKAPMERSAFLRGLSIAAGTHLGA